MLLKFSPYMLSSLPHYPYHYVCCAGQKITDGSNVAKKKCLKCIPLPNPNLSPTK